ncbi:MAG TPA: hypothetical protein VJU61_25290, partial [Polyangiaceae bacterium]|nr:hypothetical protein [Polyangiaceae bacterium]
MNGTPPWMEAGAGCERLAWFVDHHSMSCPRFVHRGRGEAAACLQVRKLRQVRFVAPWQQQHQEARRAGFRIGETMHDTAGDQPPQALPHPHAGNVSGSRAGVDRAAAGGQ